MDSFGKRFAFLLHKHLIKAKEVAGYLDIPLERLEDYLTDRELPKLGEAIQIAEYFGVSLDWLVTGRGHIERHEEYNYQNYGLTKDADVSGKIDLDVQEDVVLPDGKTIKERRTDFRSPFVKEIVEAIRKLNTNQRQELLSYIHLTFSTENN